MNGMPISGYKDIDETLVFFNVGPGYTDIKVNQIAEVSVTVSTLTIKLTDNKQYNFVAKPLTKKQRVRVLLMNLRDMLDDVFPDDDIFWENNGERVSEIMRCIGELKQLNNED
jgi:hypothetical protein